MNGMLLSLMALLLAIPGPLAKMYRVSCFDDRHMVGMTATGRVALRERSGWQLSALANDAINLWRSPDNRIFISTRDSMVVEVPHGPKSAMSWQLQRGLNILGFAHLGGVVAITPERMYRLEPGGNVTDIGATPAGPGGTRPHRAPVLIDGGSGRLIACYGTSVREADDMQGECMAPDPHAYQYLADFGESIDAGGHFVPPFACGNSVISVRHGVTQARDLKTGALLGRITTAPAREGSGCLDNERAVLVGKRDIQIVDVPGLRPLWRSILPRPIETAAICGRKFAAFVEDQSDPVLVDLPPGAQKPPAPAKLHPP